MINKSNCTKKSYTSNRTIKKCPCCGYLYVSPKLPIYFEKGFLETIIDKLNENLSKVQ